MNATQLLQHFDRLAEAPDAVPRLRRFILDLAVRGKLVAQVAGDEPASELLKRIRTERLRVLKKAVKTNVTATDGSDIELPAGWEWSKLDDLCIKTGSGSTPSGGKDAYVAAGVPFLRSQNVYDDGLRLDGVAFISEAIQERMSSTTVKAGDLLLNITGGSIGRCAIVPDTFVIGNINQHVAIIRLALLEGGRFLHSVICSDYFQRHIFGNQTGAGREGLPKNRMDEIVIPVPPLAEQHRIVAKVDELMALCDQLEAAQQERERRRDRLAAASLQRLNQPASDTTPEAQREHAGFHLQQLPRLTTRPEHIKAMRQTIRKLAVRGLLKTGSAKDESVDTLVNRIEIAKHRAAKHEGLKKDKGLRDGLTKEPPFNIPRYWKWLRLQDIFEISRGGSPRPAGDPMYFGGTVPWITVGEITKDLAKHLVATENGLTELGSERSRFIYPGDLLLTNSGATLGVPKISKLKGCINDGVAVLRKFHSEDINDYSYLYLQSQTDDFRSVNQGMGQPNLNTPIIAGWYIPLPPLAEQQRIVAKVDELMALCDQLEAQLSTTQTDSRRLLESVLEAALEPVH